MTISDPVDRAKNRGPQGVEIVIWIVQTEVTFHRPLVTTTEERIKGRRRKVGRMGVREMQVTKEGALSDLIQKRERGINDR